MLPKYEKEKLEQGFRYIIGCDEVGRGCLAGPVVAAAVILNSKLNLPAGKAGIENLGINDSKVLTANQREKIEPLIKQHCIAWSIGSVSQEEVDEINIHNASLLAMKRAVEQLPPSGVILRPQAEESHNEILRSAQDDALVLVDGKFKIPDLAFSQEAIIDGDAKILSIAAASIIAKVYRDCLMKQLGEQYPNYQFGKHKGYATQIHRTAIKNFGLTPLHRLTFCSQYM